MPSSNRSIKKQPSRSYRHLIARIKINAFRVFMFFLVAVVSTLGVFMVVRAAGPIISATKTDAFVGGDGDGKADPGETIRYTTTITNSAAPGPGNDATGVILNDIIDIHTTLVSGSISVSPLAVNDTFPVTVTGNVQIDSASLVSPFSVIDNDYQGQNMSPAISIGAYDATTVQGGQVVMTTSGANIGKFTYNPPPGFEGTDTFTYTLIDNANAPSAAANRTATVSIPVSGMVWFINNSAPSCVAAGCGRLSNPFSTLAAFNSLNDNAGGNHPGNNDNIFIYESATGYSGAVTLLSGQKLIGQDATASLSSITGLTTPTGSPSFPAMNSGNGTFTSIVSTVTLNTDAEVRGLQINSTTSTGMNDPAGAISGVNVSEVSVATSTGTAVLLSSDGGTFSFQSVSSNGAVNGISLTSTTGSFTVTGDSGSTNNSSGGTIQNTTGDGISLTNAQNIALDQMNIQTTHGSGINGTTVTNFAFTNGTINGAGDANQESAIAFNGTGSLLGNNIAGTLTVTGNTFTNPFYSGLDVQSDNGTVSNADVSSNVITNPGFAGVNLVGTGNASTAFNLTKAIINQNNISSSGGTGVQVIIGNSNASGPGATAGAGGANLVSITNNAVSLDTTGINAIIVANSGANSASRTKTNFIIQCNGSTAGSCTSPNNAGIGSSNIGTVILIGNNGSSDMTGVVDSNKIVATHTVGGGGGNGIGGGNGVTLGGGAETPHLILTVTNNTISGVDGNGILLVGRGTSGLAEFGIRNNTVAAPLSGVRQGIRVDAGNASSGDDAVCLDISGNTSAPSVGGPTALGIGLRKQGTVTTTNDFGVEGMAATGTPGVETYVNGLNPAGGGTLLVSATSGFSNCSTLALERNNNQTVAQAKPRNNPAVGAQAEIMKSANAFASSFGSTAQVAQTFNTNINAALVASVNKDSVSSVTVASGSSKLSNLEKAASLVSAESGSHAPRLFSIHRAPAKSGETVDVTIGTLPAGKSVTVMYDVTVDALGSGEIRTRILNQGTVNYDPSQSVLTTDPTPNPDPACVGTSPKTCTPVDRPDANVTSISRHTPAGANTNASSVTWRVTFDTAVAGLTSSNFNLVNGGLTAPSITSVSAVTASPDTQWDVTANTGTGDGTLGLDMVNDNGLSHDVFTLPFTGEVYTVDKTAPKVSSIMRQSPASSPTNVDVLVFRVTFDEPVTSVGAGSFVVTGTTTTITNVASVTPNLVFDFTVDGTVSGNLPGLNGAVGLNVAASPAVTDLAGNTLQVVEPTPAATNDQTYTVDNTGPLVSSIVRQSPATNPTNADILVFRVTFNEPVTNVGASSFVVTGTTTPIAGVSSVTPNLVFDFTIDGTVSGNLPTLNGTVGLNITASPTVKDLAGNTLQVVEPTPAATNDQTYTVDNIAPTVTVEQAAGQPDPTNSLPIHFTATFSEPVTGFTSGEVSLGGTANPLAATITEIAPNDGTTYDIAVTTISNNGTVTASILAGLVQDTAGNTNALSTSVDNTVTYDNVAPTVTINQKSLAPAQADPTSSSPINFTVTFSEPVSGFVTGDVNLSASTAIGTLVGTVTGGPTVYNVAVSGMTGDGLVIASIDAGVATDGINNNTASTSTDNSVLYDTVPPSVTIEQAVGQADPTSANPINFTAVFSEAVTGFGDLLSDVTLTGTASATVTSITESGPMNGTTYTVSVTATSKGTVIASVPASKAQDLAGQNNTASTSTDNSVTYVPPTDLSITKTDGVTTATPGGSLTYTITASNAGPNADPSVTVADTFPASLSATWTCSGAGGGTCTASSSGNINDTVNLPVGGSVTYTVSASISASATGTLSNTATVSSSISDTNSGNNSDTDTDTLTPQANLGITKTDGLTTATPGGSVTYTITASNAGPSNASGATVADTFPASLTPTWTCAGAGGGACTASGFGNINDTVNLPAGGSVTYTVSASINASATGTLSNTATVTAPGGVTDPTPGNNSATDSDTLSPQADLSITKTDGVTIALPGGSLTYTITASNAGPSNAPGATVADIFPASLTSTWTCVGAAGGTCTASGVGNINDTVNLPVGGSVTYTVSASVSAAATGTLSNTATVSAPAGVTDPTPGNNSATDSDTTVPPVDVTINQAPGQADPTNASPINFSVVFASAVTDFDDASDVTLSGTAVATTIVITGGPTTYNVAVSGITGDGTVTATIEAGVATGSLGEPNAASTSTDNTVTYDATAPNTIIDAPTPVNPTNITSADFTFHGNDGTGVGGLTFQCKLDSGSYSACTSPKNYPGPLTNGSHTFLVYATDSLGNTDLTPASYTWTVDTSAPTVVVSSVTTSATHISPVIVTITFSEAVTGFTPSVAAGDIVIGGVGGVDSNPQVLSSTVYTFDLAPSGQGAVTVVVPSGSAFDAATNPNTVSNTFSITYDTVAPNTIIDTNPTNPTASNSAAFTFHGTDPGGSGIASYECDLDGGGLSFSACTSPRNYTGMTNGSHTFQVRAIDNAGNVDSTPASFTWVVDTTAPDTSILTNPTNPTNSATGTFTFNGNDGTGVGGLTFECKLDSGAYGACTSPKSYASLIDGSHTFQVRAIDQVGNVDASPASYTWTVDTIAPTAVITSSAANPTNTAPIPVTITFSEPVYGFGSLLAANDLILTNGTASDLITGSDGSTVYTFTITPGGQGAVTVYLKIGSVHDLTGNNNTAVSNTLSRTYDSIAPTVTNVTSTVADGTYLIGTVIPITITFSEAVTVTGTPQLTLETGAIDRAVNYTSGSGTTTLTFNYTSRSGDSSADLDYVSTNALALNGGTIRDTATNNAILTLPAPGAPGSLGANKEIVIIPLWKIYLPLFIPCTVDGNCGNLMFLQPTIP